jgi:SecD/SecF fusion protein
MRAGSAIIAMVGVVAYMIASYGLFGVFASVAVIANVILILAVMSMIGATLTLPGIAGIVLTVGMAVDANVIIFERIREELRAGKRVVKAIDDGFSEAMSAIIDANVTTFISAMVMFFLGSGPVKGFAVTLTIGIVTSVFTADLSDAADDRAVAGMAQAEATGSVRGQENGIPSETCSRRDQFQLLPLAMADLRHLGGGHGRCRSSAVLVMGLNFGIDFKGGTTIRTESTTNFEVGAYRTALEGLGLGDVSITEVFDPSFGADKHVAMIRIGPAGRRPARSPPRSSNRSRPR